MNYIDTVWCKPLDICYYSKHFVFKYVFKYINDFVRQVLIVFTFKCQKQLIFSLAFREQWFETPWRHRSIEIYTECDRLVDYLSNGPMIILVYIVYIEYIDSSHRLLSLYWLPFWHRCRDLPFIAIAFFRLLNHLNFPLYLSHPFVYFPELTSFICFAYACLI